MGKQLSELGEGEIEWYLGNYGRAIASKSALTTGSVSSGPTLVELDAWYQTLPSLCQLSDLSLSIHSKVELDRLMQWKLRREKHRPTLLSLIRCNSPTTCKDILIQAATFLLSKDPVGDQEKLALVQATMKILCQLKGVGPATSSALVASWSPYGIFQSDELVSCLLGPTVKIQYSWSFYDGFYRKAIALATSRNWSGKQLEQIAWSISHLTPPPSSPPVQDPPSPRERILAPQSTPIPLPIKRSSPSQPEQPEPTQTTHNPPRHSKRLRSQR